MCLLLSAYLWEEKTDARCKGGAIKRKKKQIWSILSLVDVNALLTLCVDVEACLEKPQTVCETFVVRLPMVKGDVMLGAKETPMKGD